MPRRARRLAAIMFTDLVGFTRLAQRDEEAALRLRAEHQQLVRPRLAEHGGREVKTLGDGFLIEFPSAVDSLRCAVEIQRAVAERNASSPTTDPIQLRIGIHLGDVIEEGNDIVGDAVNVASRIEPLAEPGGICVSGSIYDQVRNKLSLRLEKIGSRTLKNVEYPVDVYRVEFSSGAVASRARSSQTSGDLRLAVLPFANMSPNAEDDYIADGLTDELISQTSRIPSLRVIARTSVLRYKGSTKPIREVGQDLGVRLALEGSVRKAGNRLRITVQLVDTSSEVHLWSSRYDRSMDDIFAIQDDIASQVATSITSHVAGHGSTEVPRFVPGPADTTDLEAYSNFLHGRQIFGERLSAETGLQALALFENAVRRDPQFARARVGIAEVLLWLENEGATRYVESHRRARQELGEALRLNDDLGEAHSVLAGLLLADDDVGGTEREARRALELNPSLSDPYRWLAQLAAGNGDMDEAVRLLETARILNPVDVNITAFLGRAYAYAGKYDAAIAFWERTEAVAPYRTNAHRAEYHLGRGDYEAAGVAIRALERLRPESPTTEMYRGFLAARLGDTETARRSLEELDRRSQRGELAELYVGYLHFALGEMDAFVGCMERSFEQHNLPLLELLYSPLYAPARSDPRIVDLVRRQQAIRPSPQADGSPSPP